jgi:serine/threonine protein kinase
VEGTTFGRYQLVELLGRGGMGEVWRAFDPEMNRMVAMKVLSAHRADDRIFQERFRREAQAAAGLDEPHVVPIYESGVIDGRLFVTMRLIQGCDLQSIIDEGPLPPGRAVAIVEQIAAALQAAHRIGLVHRDVKPSNILVAEDDFAYLIDFGIARAAEESRLTSTGEAVGTLAYMAPERLDNSVSAASTDIYSLACVLYQSITGEQPFPGPTLKHIAIAHLTQPPPTPSTHRAGIPAGFDDVIATGMAKDPKQRYPTTKELALAARAALTAPATSSYPTSAMAEVEPVRHDGPEREPPRQNGPEPEPPRQDVLSAGHPSPLASHAPAAIGHETGATTNELDWDTGAGRDAGTRRRGTRRARLVSGIAAAAALGIVVTLILIFGHWPSGPDTTSSTDSTYSTSPACAGQSRCVIPVRATVFSPGGDPDNPGEADRAIAGSGAAWSTDTYTDAVPFPIFKSGEGLLLRLPSPTRVGSVSVNVASTGTVIQIRAAATPDPSRLGDTTELSSPTTMSTGVNTIPATSASPTSYVLVWISTLGTIDGKSRSELSGILVTARQ